MPVGKVCKTCQTFKVYDEFDYKPTRTGQNKYEDECKDCRAPSMKMFNEFLSMRWGNAPR